METWQRDSVPPPSKDGFWRYAGGILTILFFWLILGSAPILVAFAWAALDGNPATTIDPATGMLLGVDPILGGYLLPNLTFPIFLLGIFLAVRVFHGRGLRTLVTPAPSVHWHRVWTGFWLWLLLAALATGLEIALYPAAFSWQGVGLGRYLVFVVLALIFTPLQTSTEELFFRGYSASGHEKGDQGALGTHHRQRRALRRAALR